MTFDPDHIGCAATIARLSAQVVRLEVVANTLARTLCATQDELDRIQHERAIDAGRHLGDEAEAFLAEQGGGS